MRCWRYSKRRRNDNVNKTTEDLSKCLGATGTITNVTAERRGKQSLRLSGQSDCLAYLASSQPMRDFVSTPNVGSC